MFVLKLCLCQAQQYLVPLSERQAAYIKGDSTVNQLLYLVHTIRTAWTNKNTSQGIFLDVMGAFETVWHRGLLAKLSQHKISGKCHDLFQSYLSNRKQVVVVDGQKSEVLELEAGIPQGSKLGPLLFIIYINDIGENLESEILIFADDTTIIAHGNDPDTTANQLNRDLIKIRDWSHFWKLKFGADKSRDLIFSNITHNNTLQVFFNNEPIKRVTQHKHLGIILTSNLNFDTHVHSVCLRTNAKFCFKKCQGSSEEDLRYFI